MDESQRCFDQLAWPEAQKAAKQEGSTVIWPFGACEQHGPQLPLATDALFADRILDAVLSRLDHDCPIWRLPVQSVGFSPEHQAFPGTISFRAELMLQIVEQVGSQLAAMGVQRLVLFNAHGGQIGLLQVAARQLRVRCPSMGVLPCFLWSGVTALPSLIPPEELSNGLHAGQAETSLMLRLASELVGVSRPFDGVHGQNSPFKPPEGWSLEGAAPCAWLTSDLSKTGVIGNATKASAELGEQLEQALVLHWKQRLESLLCSEWPPTEGVLGNPLDR
ncbi:creatininase family protein [Synechococcus sp. M16CYN]|uniref:creatininase family protein n=1 Tax=Synechococcus sp. M16CYN TaxID=3103139 RepID=UPI003253C56C